MPAVFLDRLPLPSLQTYIAISVLLLSCSVYYAVQVTSQPNWKLNVTADDDSKLLNRTKLDESIENIILHIEDLVLNHPLVKRLIDVVYFMIQEPLCIWTLINMAYCCLILVGKVIQTLVFGELRVSEQQHIKDKFWNFIFYKFIFIFGVMNVQFMGEVVLWCSWFTILGFLHLLAQLCKDRFEYLSFSPTTPKWTHIRLLALLSCILLIFSSLFGICVMVGIHAGINTFAFMATECALVTLRTLYVIIIYAIHLWDINHEGVWERRATYVYYTELIFELTALVIDFFHHLHMLLWGNIFLSMASLVICMQLRYLLYEIQRRIKRHKNYLRVVKHMEAKFPMASPEEIEENSDDCAICWDRMDFARKLPCGHLFHNSCLRSWLEQDTSCPTCRMALSGDSDSNNSNEREHHNNLLRTFAGQEDNTNRPGNQTTNHFFHFDGSRYVSWFPSFSVEVTHTSLLGERQATAIQTSQLDSMAREVQLMFPNMPFGLIMDDLRITHSVEQTVENILDERLVPPPSTLFQGVRSISQSSNQENGNAQAVASTSREYLESVDSSVNLSVVPYGENTSESNFENERETNIAPRSGSLGCRFSKSSQEREHMLLRRKEDMIKSARSKYLAKVQPSNREMSICHPTSIFHSESLQRNSADEDSPET